MPKHRRSRSVSFDRPSPFPPSPSSKNPPPPPTSPHQFDDVRCPVCMDHPHNAVLLLCSSHDSGCRPFLCDTSYRHSNCLDQYRRALGSPSPDALSCPLCRGLVSGSRVLPPARRHMNSKPRSCSTESCPFFGTYSELRRHARADHPLARPSDADPGRERDWRALERRRDFGDLISSLQSGFGEGEGEGDGDLLPFSTVSFFLVLRFRRSGGIGGGGGWSSGRRSRNWRRGRVLWGESIVEAEDGVDDENDVDNGDDGDDGGNDDGGGEEVDGSSRRLERRGYDDS